MAVKYRIIVRDLVTGAKRAIIDEFEKLSYSKKRNAPGQLDFTLKTTAKASSFTANDTLVEVWRKNDDSRINLLWYVDFYGLFLAESRVIDTRTTFSAQCPGLSSILADRIVAYRKGSPLRSLFTSQPTETIMNTLVKYNMTSSGTVADGRSRLATVTNFTVGTNLARGPTVTTWDCAYENLLDTLQNLGKQTKTSFEVVRSGTSLLWQYVVNNDLTASQVFSTERKNVQRIEYSYDRTKEKTIAIIGGKGDDETRIIETGTGANYSAANNREMFVNAGSEDLASERLAVAVKQLKDTEAIKKYTFVPRQTFSSYYGKHYQLNDKVKGRYENVSLTLVVDEVSVSVSSANEETVNVTLSGDI